MIIITNPFPPPTVVDISNWHILHYINTRGSRDKWVIEDRLGAKHYFKVSINRTNYEYEFWSEIIAYHLGTLLHLPVLEYQPAILNRQVGCLCKSFLHGDEQLIEGLNIIQAYDPTFDPNYRLGRNRYSFQLIVKSLVNFGQSFRLSRLIQTIVFDAIIGNQDRHQENWGFKIWAKRKNKAAIGVMFTQAATLLSKGYALTSMGHSEYLAYLDVTFDISISDLEIYDNGSSLGRELGAQQIRDMLSDEKKLLKYINRGKAEIRWNDTQISHYELISKLYNEGGYDTMIDPYIRQMVALYDETAFRAILNSVDQGLGSTFANYMLPPERKDFIAQLVTKRIQLLKTIV